MNNINSLVAEAKARRTLPSPAMRRAIRQNANVSLRRVAQALGVSVQAVQHWETGARSPRPENIGPYLELLSSLEDVAK